MKNFRFAGRIFNTPLMICEEKLNVILHVLGPRFDLDMESLPPIDAREVAESERCRAGYIVRNGTAIIPISGTLVHRSGYLDALSGMTSYESLRSSFDLALEDDAVQKIIFDVDSPGGEVTGCFDLSDHIFKSRGKKPMTAIVNESCYSAAYALASAADRIVVPRTGGAGSVGVILAHVDQSALNEKTGVKVTHIFAGKHKADFSPHHPLSEEAKTRLQGMVTETYNLFVETVARNRGMSAGAVRKTEADIFIGSKAVSVGLADQVAAVDVYLSGSTGTSNPARMAATEPAPAIEEPKNPLQAARDHFTDPATAETAYAGNRKTDPSKATDTERSYFQMKAHREAMHAGAGLTGDAALLQEAKPAARSFAEIADFAYANRETAKQEQQTTEETPQEQAAAHTSRPPTNDKDRLADIATRVYGPRA